MSDAVIEVRPSPSHARAAALAPSARTGRCSVGVMAYNEAQNIGLLLEALSAQRLEGFSIDEIIVVASGCTDGTEEVVRRHRRRDRRIRLLVQRRREGKASAVNLFLGKARGEVLVLESADTLPAPEAFSILLAPFADPSVGMTGARPRPVDSRSTVMGYSSHFLWSMHHTLALDRPKLGELVAFRRLVGSIPEDTAVDEAAIEAAIVRAGYGIRYSQDAIVFNKGPESLHDYMVQRRRIIVGHKHLAHTEGYAVASTQLHLVLRTFARKLWIQLRLAARLARQRQWRSLARFLRHRLVWSLYGCVAVSLEVLASGLGAWDYHVRHRNPFIWEIARSTKRLR